MGYKPTLEDAKNFVEKIAKGIDPSVKCVFPQESAREWFRRDRLLVILKKHRNTTKEAIEITIEDVVFDVERHDQTKEKIRAAIATLGA